MSLASHNPEKFDEACRDAIVAALTKYYVPWRDGDEQAWRDNLAMFIEELTMSGTPAAGRPVYEALMDLPGVNTDALDRFHAMFR